LAELLKQLLRPIEKELLQSQPAVQIGCAPGIHQTNEPKTSPASQDLGGYSPGIPAPAGIAEQVNGALGPKADDLARVVAGHLLHGSVSRLAAIDADGLQTKDRSPGGQATSQMDMDEHISTPAMNDEQGWVFTLTLNRHKGAESAVGKDLPIGEPACQRSERRGLEEAGHRKPLAKLLLDA
jgi:hypothetical protein